MTGWAALVPQKSLSAAKGRLALDPRARRLLATAMLRDTVASLQATPGVQHVIILWEDRDDLHLVAGVESLHSPNIGLNAALEAGACTSRLRDPSLNLVVAPGDLPALLPHELAVCLERASRRHRAFLADSHGSGTTILTATGDSPLVPSYGEHSAAIHAITGAHRLGTEGVDTVRLDVDDLTSLAAAMSLGCGYHTLVACASLGLAPEAVR